VIRKHYEEGRVNQSKWSSLVVRANEIGARDLEQKFDPPKEEDLDDEIPF
jgi:hypothetical protein